MLRWPTLPSSVSPGEQRRESEISDYDSFFEMMAASLNMQPGSADIVDELRKVKGLQIRQRSVMSMMGTEVSSSTEVMSAEEADPPVGIYEVPAGYSVAQLDLMAELQKGAK